MSKSWIKHCNFTLIDSESALITLSDRLKSAEVIALDCETSGLDWLSDFIVGISISPDKDEGYYISIAHAESNNISLDLVKKHLYPILLTKRIVYYNASFDRAMFRSVNMDLPGEDVMVLIYHKHTERYSKFGLKKASKTFLNREMIEFEDLFTDEDKKRVNRKKPPLFIYKKTAQECLEYACSDAVNTWLLYTYYRPELPKRMERVYELDIKFIDYILEMQNNGFNIDQQYLIGLRERLLTKINMLQEDLNKEAGFEVNPEAGASIWQALQSFGIQPSSLTATGKPAYDADTLSNVDHPFAKKVCDYRLLTKTVSTFIDSMLEGIHPKTGRCHSMYPYTFTSTGRLSSMKHPTKGGVNAQQISKMIIPDKNHVFYDEFKSDSIRKAIVPPKGFILCSLDWSAIELRIAAHFSQEPVWLNGFKNNEDLHQKLADTMNAKLGLDISRAKAKNAQFNMLYAFYWSQFAQSQKISMGEAEMLYKAFFGTVTHYDRWRESYKKKAFNQGYSETMYGRRRIIGNYEKSKGILVQLNSDFKTLDYEEKQRFKEAMRHRSAGDREAINARIQGTCLDINKHSCLKIRKKLMETGLWLKDVLPMANIHDEICLAVRGEIVGYNKDSDGNVISIDVSPLVKDVLLMVKQIMEDAPIGFTVPLVADCEAGLNWKDLYKVNLERK